VHNVTKGANFGTDGIIKKYLGDLANSRGKEYQEATSKANSKKSTAHYDSPGGSVTQKKQSISVRVVLIAL